MFGLFSKPKLAKKYSVADLRVEISQAVAKARNAYIGQREIARALEDAAEAQRRIWATTSSVF